MAAEIPDIEPTSFLAGDTVKWTKSLSDYSAADSWVLVYYFVGQSKRLTVTCTADGSDHLATISATNSAALPPGDYQVTARVGKAGEFFTVWTGRITVKLNPAVGASGADTRSMARKLLEAVEHALLGIATREESSYSISPAGGTARQIQFCSREELMTMRSRLKNEVAQEEAAERIAQGFGSGRLVKVRFTRP